MDALAAQRDHCFGLLVVDQSDVPNPDLRERLASDPSAAVIDDVGRGLSRARNIGWRSTETSWVVYIDDDVVPEPEWAGEMRDAIDRHPGASIVMGNTPGRSSPDQADQEYLTVSEFLIDREQELRGRWVRPWFIGFTLNQAFRRSTLEELGGFDERLGAGAPDFPSSDDMDMNYRFLRGGGTAALSPAARAYHTQWRPREALGPHYEGYMRGWCGFAMKHLRRGDVAGGLWLWSLGFADFARMTASSVRRRSRLRFTISWHKARGLAVGTATGLVYPW